MRMDEAGVFTRLHFTAEFSKPVREAMEWDDVHPSIQSAKLDGEINATKLSLIPGNGLEKHELVLDCRSVSDFQIFRVKGDDGESAHTELRFIVRTQALMAAGHVEDYLRKIGGGAAQLKITHQDQMKLGEK